MHGNRSLDRITQSTLSRPSAETQNQCRNQTRLGTRGIGKAPMICFLVVFVSVLIGLLSVPASGDSQSHMLRIAAQVVDVDGRSIEGAVVITNHGGQGVSDAHGQVAFDLDLATASHAQDDAIHITAIATRNSTNLIGNACVPTRRTAPPDSTVVPKVGQRETVRSSTERRNFNIIDAGTIPLRADSDCEPQWLPMFGGQPGVDWTVHAMTVFDDGSGNGPALYVGGRFTHAAGLRVNGIARWDGVQWSAVSDGVQGVNRSRIHSLAVFDDGNGPAMFAGGFFTMAGNVPANHIARWDGQSWTPLGEGVSGGGGGVLALAVHDDGSGPALYAGGSFTSAGGLEANHIARWDGENWSSLGEGFDHFVYALESFDDGSGDGPHLYAGGPFTLTGDTEVLRLARWDGTAWSSVGGGVGNSGVHRVHALKAIEHQGERKLYVGGNFRTAGEIDAWNLAVWDGAEWSTLGTLPYSNPVQGIDYFPDDSEDFPRVVVSGPGISEWNGEEWIVLGSGNGPLHVFDDGQGDGPVLYAAQSGPNYIARWDGELWGPLGNGIDNAVNAIAVFDDGLGQGPMLYAGGRFTTIDGVAASRIARWDGEAWLPVGTGVSGAWVAAMTVFDDGTGPALYVGGSFDGAGGVEVSDIARWDGKAWSSVGGGVSGATNNRVLSIYVFDDGSGPALYVGGVFRNAGEIEARNIARWDGKEWSPMGSGMNGSVLAMEAFDDGTGPALYVGGQFRYADDMLVDQIARWDGNSWSDVDGGIPGFVGSKTVHALKVFDDGSDFGPALYIGGSFAKQQGAPGNRILRWNGTEWSEVGEGMDPFGGSLPFVGTLEVFDDGDGPALFAGGLFQFAEGQRVNNIAKWNGESWVPLENGVSSLSGSSWVHALLAIDSKFGLEPSLLVGGSFTLSPSGDANLARWGGCSKSDSQPIPGDVNGDGIVNGADLTQVIIGWATNDPSLGDANGDGIVNVQDLLLVISNWGATG